ncbi:MAG: CRTAC1 family protein [Flavobacteriales bacterium]|nr:CRTAC1 family protein [Flavobacteriales bacterium]
MKRFPSFLMGVVLGVSLILPISGWSQFNDVSNQMDLFTDHTGGNWGAGMSMADFNGDGLDDLSFAHYGGVLKFFEGNGTGFTELVLNMPAYLNEAKGILWADIDNDGDQDLFVTYRLAPNRLYRNDGEMTLVDISDVCGIAQTNQRSYGASFGDYDKDGLLDLFVANYVLGQDYPHNELYHNLGGGLFEDVTSDTPMGEVVDNSFQGHWVDFNEDGNLDLHLIQDRLCFENRFYEQVDGVFTEVANERGLDYAINCMSTSVADYDRDNDLDLYLTAGLFEGNFLLNNTGGSFTPHVVEEGDSTDLHLTSWAANWFDADNDGWDDLHVATGFSVYSQYPQVFAQYPDVPNAFYWNSEGVFSQDTAAIFQTNQLSFATAVGDYNGDGFPDLVSHRFGEYAQVLEGIPNQNKWLKVSLVGVESNRDGIGAKIRAYFNGEVTYRMTFCGENYMGQNSRWETFGLGTENTLDSLTVHWPSGIVDHYYDVLSLQSLVLIEGASIEPSPCPSLDAGCFGCTYVEACNFNDEAVADDGTCDFSCFDGSISCGEGTVWDPLIGQCIAGPVSDCPSDINEDGVVNTADLLWFLAQFDIQCPE